MVQIPSNFPVYGPKNVGATGNFTDAAFSQLGDAAWQAVLEAQNYPNAVNIQTMMQCVNALNAYLAANPVPAGDPQAKAVSDIQKAFAGNGGMVGETFAQVCQMYGTTNCQAAVETFQGQISLLQNVYNALNEVKTVGSQNNKEFQSDVEQLQADIVAYNQYFEGLNHQGNCKKIFEAY
jgi:ribosomal protein S5